MEFIDVAHTPKNILIRAVRRPVSNAKKQQEALEQVRALTNEFQFYSPIENNLFYQGGTECSNREEHFVPT